MNVKEIVSNHIEDKGATPEIIAIVTEYLEDNEYDGLFWPGECACLIGSLFPCDADQLPGECEPGYKKDGCNCGSGHKYHVVKEKP